MKTVLFIKSLNPTLKKVWISKNGLDALNKTTFEVMQISEKIALK